VERLNQLNRENVALSYQIEEAMADLTDLEMLIKENAPLGGMLGGENEANKTLEGNE